MLSGTELAAGLTSGCTASGFCLLVASEAWSFAAALVSSSISMHAHAAASRPFCIPPCRLIGLHVQLWIIKSDKDRNRRLMMVTILMSKSR